MLGRIAIGMLLAATSANVPAHGYTTLYVR